MKLTKKLLEQYIRKAMKESRWDRRGYSQSAERRREMNIGTGASPGPQSDWYVDDNYEPPPAPIYKSHIERAQRIAAGNKMTVQLMVDQCIELAPTVQDEDREPTIEHIAAEVAAKISSQRRYTITKEDLLTPTHRRTIGNLLDAAIKDHRGIPLEPRKT